MRRETTIPTTSGRTCVARIAEIRYETGGRSIVLEPLAGDSPEPPRLRIDEACLRAAERAQDHGLAVEVVWRDGAVSSIATLAAAPVPESLRDRLRAVRLVLLDVDGVLTSGAKTYSRDGLAALDFDARDGFGIGLLVRAGIEVALVTHGASDVVAARARDLGIEEVRDVVEDKGAAVRDLLASSGRTRSQALFVGDDLRDLAAFAEVGVSVAVADAAARVREAADWVTGRRGGEGAVREVADAILAAQEIDALSLLGGPALAETLLGRTR
jgi:3-deoxy-D-manno-octulosonate 8-phosphate phosphatase (KDO 8-P phosphatase)